MADSTTNDAPHNAICPLGDVLGTSTPSRSPSRETQAIHLDISIATPVTVRSDLEATEARSRKRKLARELVEDDASKRMKTTNQAGSIKNRGGRPKRETPIPPRQPKGALRLRVSKPVNAFLPPEIWKLILEQSSPALLLRARALSRSFYNVLTYGSEQSTWTAARKLTYGDHHPDPPTGVDEIQYADLLEGHGCQSCKNVKTRKTYWAFLRRWCESCLNDRVVPVIDLASPQRIRSVFTDGHVGRGCRMCDVTIHRLATLCPAGSKGFMESLPVGWRSRPAASMGQVSETRSSNFPEIRSRGPRRSQR